MLGWCEQKPDDDMGPEITSDRHAQDGKESLVAETWNVDSISLCAFMCFALDLTKQMRLSGLVVGHQMTDVEGVPTYESVQRLGIEAFQTTRKRRSC